MVNEPFAPTHVAVKIVEKKKSWSRSRGGVGTGSTNCLDRSDVLNEHLHSFQPPSWRPLPCFSFKFAGRRGARCPAAPSGPSAEGGLPLTAGTEPAASNTLHIRDHVKPDDNLKDDSTDWRRERDYRPGGRTQGIKLGSGRRHIWTWDSVRGCCCNQWVCGL